MSKSEYKRLAVQIPDVVKTIREHALDESIEALKKELYKINFSVIKPFITLDKAVETIEKLKETDKRQDYIMHQQAKPQLISNCCGYPAGEYEDIGICPACKEHCEFILEGEDDE